MARAGDDAAERKHRPERDDDADLREDIDAVELAQRIVVLNFGQKLAEGRPLQIRKDPKVLEAYLGGSAR